MKLRSSWAFISGGVATMSVSCVVTAMSMNALTERALDYAPIITSCGRDAGCCGEGIMAPWFGATGEPCSLFLFMQQQQPAEAEITEHAVTREVRIC